MFTQLRPTGGGHSRQTKARAFFVSLCVAALTTTMVVTSLIAAPSGYAATGATTQVVTVTPDCSAPHTDTSYHALLVRTQASGLTPGTNYETAIGDNPSTLNWWAVVNDGPADAQGNLDHTGSAVSIYGTDWAVGTTYMWIFNYNDQLFTLKSGACNAKIVVTPVRPRIQRVSTVMHQSECVLIPRVSGVTYRLANGQAVTGCVTLAPLKGTKIHPTASDAQHVLNQSYGAWSFYNDFNPKLIRVIQASGYALTGNGRVRVDTIGATAQTPAYKLYYLNGKHVAPFKYVRPGQTAKIVGKIPATARYDWFRNHSQTMVLVVDCNPVA